MTPFDEFTALVREFGRQDVLEVCRALLPAADVDAIESRLRQNRRSAAVPAVGFSGPAAVEAVAQQPSQDGAA